jgi:membrane protease YdiL (CAAX protease family)
MIDKRVILSLALLTLIVFPLIGMAIVKYLAGESIQVMVRQSSPFYLQFGIGVAVGGVMGLIAFWLTERPLLKPSTQKYSRLLGALKLNTIDKVVISICAGFGEELLFRGAIQVFWGIWPTAVLFVAIHGYLNPRDWRISIYGAMMTIFIAILGYLTEWYGIWAAATAHGMIDLVLLMMMKDAGPHVTYPEFED